jgi:hypothetical protein
VNGIRYFLRNFTATAVKEHLRSQVEDSDGSPRFTTKELELLHFVRDGSIGWDDLLSEGE